MAIYKTTNQRGANREIGPLRREEIKKGKKENSFTAEKNENKADKNRDTLNKPKKVHREMY